MAVVTAAGLPTIANEQSISSRYLRIYQRTLTKGGVYHCTADLLFDWFGFDQTSKSVIYST